MLCELFTFFSWRTLREKHSLFHSKTAKCTAKETQRRKSYRYLTSGIEKHLSKPKLIGSVEFYEVYNILKRSIISCEALIGESSEESILCSDSFSNSLISDESYNNLFNSSLIFLYIHSICC